jgi:hypothetical protein
MLSERNSLREARYMSNTTHTSVLQQSFQLQQAWQRKQACKVEKEGEQIVGCPALLHTQKFLFAVVTHRDKKTVRTRRKVLMVWQALKKTWLVKKYPLVQ